MIRLKLNAELDVSLKLVRAREELYQIAPL